MTRRLTGEAKQERDEHARALHCDESLDFETIGKRLGISGHAASKAVKRGQQMFEDETFSERSLNLCRRWIERNMKPTEGIQYKVPCSEYKELVERNFGIFGISEETFIRAAEDLGYKSNKPLDSPTNTYFNMVEK